MFIQFQAYSCLGLCYAGDDWMLSELQFGTWDLREMDSLVCLLFLDNDSHKVRVTLIEFKVLFI